jgi:hypothetical protein
MELPQRPVRHEELVEEFVALGGALVGVRRGFSQHSGHQSHHQELHTPLFPQSLRGIASRHTLHCWGLRSSQPFLEVGKSGAIATQKAVYQ